MKHARVVARGVEAGALDLVVEGAQLLRAEGRVERTDQAGHAERAGLASRVFPADMLESEALAVAAKIAAQSPIATAMNKDMVNAAYETTLSMGLTYERRLFHSLFAFDDQKEGMGAFVEKRKPAFKGT